MARQVELMMVTENNNNKFYKMCENSDGTFTAFWGRVGSKENVTNYPMSKWEAQYSSKIKKGYKDITSLKAVVKKAAFKDVVNHKINVLLNTLQRYAKKSIADNYTVSSENVTMAQIDRAQEILNSITQYTSQKTFNAASIDKLLTELYTVVPRKMDNVKNFILNGTGDLKKAKAIVEREQDAIDTMRGQVSLNVPQSDSEQTLEEALGIKIEECDTNEIEKIKELMGTNVSQFKNAYRVINHKTQKAFEEQKSKSFKHWTKLLWHGSRNENWLNIVQTGLVLRPTGVVITGKMFGYGIYWADKAQKSIGYTSLKGSYWASGSHNQAFLALYEVNTGVELRTQNHESWMYDLDDKKLKAKGEYDSLFAKGGADLRNNEYIIYNQNQCTIKYLVEIGA